MLVMTVIAGLVAMHALVVMPTHGHAMPYSASGIHGEHEATAVTTRPGWPAFEASGAVAGGGESAGTEIAPVRPDGVQFGCPRVPGTGGTQCCALGHPCQAIRADVTPIPRAAFSTAVVEASYTLAMPLTGSLDAVAGRAPPDHSTRRSLLGIWRN